MKTSTIALFALGGYGVYYLSQLGVAANTINVNFVGVQFLSLTQLQVSLQVQNVSNESINVNSMSGNVTMNGNNLGSISDFTQRTVPGNGQVTIPVILSISLLSLPGNILDLTQLTGQTIDFKVTGNVNVNGLVLPFNLDNPVTF